MLNLRGRLGTDSDFFRPFQPPESDATTCLFDRNKLSQCTDVVRCFNAHGGIVFY